MNSQDFRNLQEAYLDVYTELDEGRGDDLRKKHRLKPGEISRRLSHRADVRSFRYERDDPRRVALSKLSGNAAARSQGDTDLHGQEERVRRGGRITGTNIHTDADRDRGDKGERFADFVSGRRNSPNMSDVERRTVSYKKEETDLYDIILSHLLDEGYAETPEAALAIMGNMSEDWRESIAEDAAYNTLKGFGYPGALVSAGLNNLSGGKIAKPDQPTAKSTLAPKTPTVSSSGGAGGKVTVDKQYPATLNKEKGMKSTGETGTEYFTPNIRGTNITDLNRSKFKSVASQQYEKIPSDQASQLRTAVPKVSDQTKYDPTYKPISMRRPGNFRT